MERIAALTVAGSASAVRGRPWNLVTCWNTSAWSISKVVFPWHEMITVFTGAFLVLHVALLALDPYAKVGVIGAFVPGLSEYRSPAVALGTVALYSMIVTAVTARWTRLLPAGWWLKVHRLAAVAFLLSWTHAVLAGTDGGALLPLYLGTGLPILAFVAHRWWARRTPPEWATSPGEAPPTGAIANPAPRRPLPVAVTMEDR